MVITKIGLIVATLLMLNSSHAWSATADEAMYDTQLVDIYAELYPDRYEADIISVVYLACNGSDPVYLRCEGNFKRISISGDQPNLAFKYDPPYFFFYNISSTSQKIEFTYRVRHDGTSTSGAIIATNKLNLNADSYWYPRNVATDSHQVILNVVTETNYRIYANASTTRDIQNNFKRLRTFVISKPVETGMTLSGTP